MIRQSMPFLDKPVDDSVFEQLISRAIDEMPKKYIEYLDNVAITYADEPTEHQRAKAKLREHSLLLGLYEGIPLTQRGAGYNLVLPDKITLFKNALMAVSHDEASFYSQIKHTLWHEIAHFYGLDHDKIHEIESRWHDDT